MTLKSDPNFKEKLTFCLKNGMRNLVNFKWKVWKFALLIVYFCRKYVMLELKKYRGVVTWKMTYGFKNDKGIWWIFIKVVESNVSRAYCSSLLHVIILRNQLLFFKIFSNFVPFCPNFQIFCFPQQQKRVEKTMICFIRIQSENKNMTWNIRLFIFCMICNFF